MSPFSKLPLNVVVRRFFAKKNYVDRYLSREETVLTLASPAPRTCLYCFGYGNSGALGEDGYKSALMKTQGSGDNLKVLTTSKPRRYRKLADKGFFVKTVSSGCGFTLWTSSKASDWASKDVTLLGCGVNTRGQANPSEKQFEILYGPTIIKLPLVQKAGSLRPPVIISMSSGRTHSVLLTDAGVYSFGNNSHGQCGTIDTGVGISEIQRIDGLPDDIVDVYCGHDHSLFLASNGDVYACGLGVDGQLGVGQFVDMVRTPTRIQALKDIITIYTKFDTSFAIDKQGNLYSWGSNDYNQIGFETKEIDVFSPKLIHLPNSCGRPLKVACSATSALLLSENGDVYSWGYGFLGLGPDLDESKIPRRIDSKMFGRDADFNPECKPVDVACCLNSYFVRTSDRELFSWGQGRYGTLGLATRQDRYFPMHVSPVRTSHVMSQYRRMSSVVEEGSNLPSKGLLAAIQRRCPKAWHPYLDLIRFSRPIGSWLLFMPCAFANVLACSHEYPMQIIDLQVLALCGIGAFLMRSAGCVINDMWDVELDKMVTRTRSRPLAAGVVTRTQAAVLTGGLLGGALMVLLQFNWYTIALGLASTGLFVFYPAAKRVTNYPQAMLGLAMNWGALVGYSAVAGSVDWSVCAPLYAAGLAWTMYYDTIYAHQDRIDDAALGVGSTALAFGVERSKPWLRCFGVGNVAGISVAALNAGIEPLFVMPCAVGGAAYTLREVAKLDFSNAEACGDCFRRQKYVGWIIFSALLTGAAMSTES